MILSFFTGQQYLRIYGFQGRVGHIGDMSVSQCESILAAGLTDFVGQSGVEGALGAQSRHCHVHTVAPVVCRVGRVVDLLFLRVLATQSAVGAQPVLKRNDAEHRWACKLQPQNFVANPWLCKVGCLTEFMEYVVVETLALRRVAFPPCADIAYQLP